MLYDDKYGLWHMPFFSHIITCLSEKYELLVLLWNEDIPHKKFNWAQIIHIPEKSNKKLYVTERIEFIRKVLNEIRADIFFIDFFPFWRFWNIEEINLIIDDIYSRWWKNISFMRDMYLWRIFLTPKNIDSFTKSVKKGYGMEMDVIIKSHYRLLFDLVFKSNIHHIFLCQIYLAHYLSYSKIDGVIVFWDKKVFDIRDEFILNDDTKKAFHFAWYIPYKNNGSNIRNKNLETKNILVSTWWWLTSKDDFLKLINFLAKTTQYKITVLMWPFVEDVFRKKIEEVVINYSHMTIEWFSDDFQSKLNNSDIFFWYWGYWIFQHLFSYTWMAYIMSNYDLWDFRHRYYEQKYRTILLEEYLNVSYLNDFSSDYLTMCLSSTSSTKKFKHVSGITFSDRSSLLKIIEKIYE